MIETLKDLAVFLKDMNAATCNLMLVPVVSWAQGVSLKEVFNNWELHFITNKFL